MYYLTNNYVVTFCNMYFIDLKQELKKIYLQGSLSSLQQLLVEKMYDSSQKIKGCNGATLLHIACKEGQLDIVRALIEIYGCTLDVRDDIGNTPCHLACENGRFEIMAYFYFSQFSLTCSLQNNKGETWLHFATKSGSIALIRLIAFAQISSNSNLINLGKLVNFNDDIFFICFQRNNFTKLINSFGIQFKPDLHGNTPLDVACQEDNLTVIKFYLSELRLVLNFDFDVFIPSLLTLACQLRRLEIVEYLSQNHDLPLLIDPHIRSNLLREPFAFSSSKIRSEAAIFFATRRGDYVLYKSLLKSSSLQITNSCNDTLLHVACMSGNFDMFIEVFSSFEHAQIDPQSKNANGNTCFHIACIWGWCEIVECLISKDWSLDNQNNDGDTPIHLAIRNNQKRVFEILIKKSDLNVKNSSGETPLHIATCDFNGLGYVKAITEDSNVKSINACDIYGDTPLFNACRTKNENMIIYLMNRPKCDLLIVNERKHETLANIACRLSLSKILKEYFKKINCYPKKLRNYLGQTLIQIACMADNLDLMDFLVSIPKIYDLGEDINLLDKVYELTPLQYACKKKDSQLVKYMLKLRDCCADTKNVAGNTVLHLCSIDNLQEMAKICVHHCSLTVRNEDGDTPLHLACKRQNFALAKMYLDNISECTKMDEYVNKEGKNALHVLAGQKGALETLQYMIESKKFTSNFQGTSGNTALHFAFQNGVTSNAEYLLSLNDCRKTWLNNKGQSPLYLATNVWNFEFIKSIAMKCDKGMLLSCCTIDNINSGIFGIYTAIENVELPYIFYLLYNLVAGYPGIPGATIENLIDFLMDKKVHPDVEEMKDFFDNTILHYACMCNYSETIAKLFDAACKKMDVNCFNKVFLSPLHYACANSQDWMMFRLFQDSENNATKSLHKERSLGSVCCNSQGKQRYLIAQGAANVFNFPSVVGIGKRDSLSIGIIVLGNSAVGKTTLIRTLKMMITDDRQPVTVTEPTTGITKEEYISFKNKHRYIFYDFAGQVEFETIHSVHLQNLLTSGNKNQFTFLLLVKGTDTIQENQKQIDKWISFVRGHVRINSTTVHVVLICTHDDKFKSDKEQQQRKNALTEYFKICGADPLLKHEYPIFVNGTKADTSPVAQVMSYLEDMFISCEPVESNKITDEVLFFIQQWYSKNPCQVKDFIDKIKQNRIFELDIHRVLHVSGSQPDMIIPQELNSLVIHLNQLFCQHDILFLKPQESEPLDWWIVGTEVQNELFSKANSLFSPDYFPDHAHHSLDTYNTGVVPLSKLTEVFSDLKLETELAINYLISLEYCTEISDETAIIIGSRNSKDEKKLYFFPGLIKNEKDDNIVEEVTKMGYITSGLLIENSQSWDLRFLHILLLRLTYQFAVEKKQYYNRRIHLWKNGLQVFTDNLVEVILELKHDKVICLFLRCTQEIFSKIELAQVRHVILKVIRSLHEKMSLSDSTSNISECIVYPHPQSFSLVPHSVKIPLPELKDIFRKPTNRRAYFLSDNKPVSLRELFHFEPYVFVESKKQTGSIPINYKTIGDLCEIPELTSAKDDTISFIKLQQIFQKYSVYSANDLHLIF